MTIDHTDPEQNWGARPHCKPPIPEGAIELFSECGRILKLEGRKDGIDYRSHWFVMYQEQDYSQVMLAVRHGGGDRVITLGYNYRGHKNIAALLPSDLRYLYMHGLYDAHREGREIGQHETAKEYREAFANGRLKKRKLPGQPKCKIWIESAPMAKPEQVVA